MTSFLLRAGLTGLALWIVTLIVPGMSFVGGDTALQRVGIIFVVAVIFGVVNAIIKPIVQILSIPLIVAGIGLLWLSRRSPTLVPVQTTSVSRDEAA